MKNFNHSSPFPYKCNFNWDYHFLKIFSMQTRQHGLDSTRAFQNLYLPFHRMTLGCFEPQKKNIRICSFQEDKETFAVEHKSISYRVTTSIKRTKTTFMEPSCISFPLITGLKSIIMLEWFPDAFFLEAE